MPQTPDAKGVEFPMLHALWGWPGPAAPSFHPGVRAGAGWWSWGPRADGLLFSPPFSFFLPITILFSLVRSFGFIRYCLVKYIHTGHILMADHKGRTYSKPFYLPVPRTVLCSVYLYGSFFHYHFFLYICKLAQTFMKGIIYTQRWAPWFIPENRSVTSLNS